MSFQGNAPLLKKATVKKVSSKSGYHVPDLVCARLSVVNVSSLALIVILGQVCEQLKKVNFSQVGFLVGK